MTSIHQEKRIKELEERNEKLYEANTNLRKGMEAADKRIEELEVIVRDLAEGIAEPEIAQVREDKDSNVELVDEGGIPPDSEEEKPEITAEDEARMDEENPII